MIGSLEARYRSITTEPATAILLPDDQIIVRVKRHDFAALQVVLTAKLIFQMSAAANLVIKIYCNQPFLQGYRQEPLSRLPGDLQHRGNFLLSLSSHIV
jgi:hypothetical protein